MGWGEAGQSQDVPPEKLSLPLEAVTTRLESLKEDALGLPGHCTRSPKPFCHLWWVGSAQANLVQLDEVSHEAQSWKHLLKMFSKSSLEDRTCLVLDEHVEKCFKVLLQRPGPIFPQRNTSEMFWEACRVTSPIKTSAGPGDLPRAARAGPAGVHLRR